MKLVSMCPKCKSQQLDIKAKERLAKVLSILTGTRHYRCRKCGHRFRARDRRRVPRPNRKTNPLPANMPLVANIAATMNLSAVQGEIESLTIPCGRSLMELASEPFIEPQRQPETSLRWRASR